MSGSEISSVFTFTPGVLAPHIKAEKVRSSDWTGRPDSTVRFLFSYPHNRSAFLVIRDSDSNRPLIESEKRRVFFFYFILSYRWQNRNYRRWRFINGAAYFADYRRTFYLPTEKSPLKKLITSRFVTVSCFSKETIIT